MKYLILSLLLASGCAPQAPSASQPVQVCVTPAPQYALCSGGNVFAVSYGSQQYIAPGHYRSSPAGYRCNFVVGQNCQVVQE